MLVMSELGGPFSFVRRAARYHPLALQARAARWGARKAFRGLGNDPVLQGIGNDPVLQGVWGTIGGALKKGASAVGGGAARGAAAVVGSKLTEVASGGKAPTPTATPSGGIPKPLLIGGAVVAAVGLGMLIFRRKRSAAEAA